MPLNLHPDAKVRIIALTGPAGAGKSTVARLLELRHGFECMGFAEPLYGALAEITGLSPDTLRRRKEEPIDWIGVSPRKLLQTLGTEWGRQMIHVDLWVRIMAQRVAQAHDVGMDRIVIDDCRFVNEAGWVRSAGGEIWSVYGRSADVRRHASEDGLPIALIDRNIWNGPGADLEAQVEAAIVARP